MRAALPLLLTACASGGPGTRSGDPATPTLDDPPTGEQPVTFYQDVAPIYDRACVSCHKDGGIGPFSMDTYEESRVWAEASAAAVAARTMPPWGAVDDGSCGGHSFRDSRWVDQADIDTIVAWADAGAPEGELAERVVAETEHLTEGLDLVTPSFSAHGDNFLPDDEYRCFLVDPELTSDTFFTGYEVVPGNAAIVHHMVMMPVEGDALDQIATVDGVDGRPGWKCYSGAGEDATGKSIGATSRAITWTPGHGVVRYPDDYGVRLPAGSQIVMQMHYNLAVAEEDMGPDSTLLRLETTDSIPIEKELISGLIDEFLQTSFGPDPWLLPPGETDVVVRYNYPWDEDLPFDVDIVGVMPHMHGYGTRMKMQISENEGEHLDDIYDPLTWADPDDDCVVRVDDWEYDWQMNYFFEEPVRAPMGSDMTFTCVYDTTSATEPVQPGLSTFEEMCLMGFFLAIVP